MRWESASETHRGNRRNHNEDSVFCSSDGAIWAVADGMGGHQAGDYASDAITRSLSEVTLTANLGDCVDAIEDRLLEVNDHLRQHARTHCDGNTVGSTVVAFVAREGVGVALWAGDSRLYRLRGHDLELITRDHNPVADLLDSGGVSEDEMLAADTNVITRAVGGQRELHLDVAAFPIRKGDTLLLCSDGLYREVNADELSGALRSDVHDAVRSLMDSCLSGEAKDNVSIIVARACE